MDGGRLGSREDLDGRHFPVVVIGGGQAGLSMSYHLQRRGIGHVVLEAQTAGHEWTDRRWDSFCLVTPNWQCRLPGYDYRGAEPDGFMVRSELVGWLEAYGAWFQPPLREHASVRLLDGHEGEFELTVLVDGELETIMAEQV